MHQYYHHIKFKTKFFLISFSNSFIPWIKHPILYTTHSIKYLTSKRRVFIDCGANIGKVLDEFIPKKQGFEFYAFEPQPELADTGKRLNEEYPGVFLEFYPYAVWTENTEMDFYLSARSGKNYKDASTLMTGHTKNDFEVDFKHPVRIRAIDFSEWIAQNFTPEDYIILKMDIEGSEYDVLEKMIATGTISYVNELIIEFHQFMNETITQERHNALVSILEKQLKMIIWH